MNKLERRDGGTPPGDTRTAEMLRAMKGGEAPEDAVIRMSRESVSRENPAEAENAELKRQLAELDANQQARTSALLGMGATLRAASAVGGNPRTADQATPGELMARSLEISRGITTTGTGKAMTPAQYAKNFVDLLAVKSVVMNSGVTRVDTDAESYVFPVIKSDFTAGFVSELESLPTGGFGMDGLKVVPKKLAAADMISNELVQDSASAALNPLATSLLRSVALGFDRESFVGDGVSGKGFVGLTKTPGIQTLAVTGPLADLDPFIKAFGLLESANAVPTAIVMTPGKWATLMALREHTGSLKPLLSESAGSPTAGIQRSILGVPVWLSPYLAPADILVYEAAQVYAVWRRDAAFETSSDSGFFSDGVGIRAIGRAAIAVPNSQAVVKITISA
ncbi:phage major capsid protein [Streptomyces antarcticus]|uniref:phage major capsid protein n=1 Tax=Streptomyces antarcticus TaxID=2996458 RepID=UPI002270393B|nr:MULTISPECIES: phage major capsid protein [unclassified Streptomyces]MCY0943499.1 phage major capsid protein [Streptomyces sp. H34-AA3]MCZ4083592.1 phage major capsid protein [Streptomyces sp. H34-S5]